MSPIELLRRARVTSRKLVIVTKCFDIVKSVASENVDFPIRHYSQIDLEQAAELENCRTFEVLYL